MALICIYEVGVAGFEPTASSSRSNGTGSVICGKTARDLRELSASVHGCAPQYGAVVAQLDTQLDDFGSCAAWASWLPMGHGTGRDSRSCASGSQSAGLSLASPFHG